MKLIARYEDALEAEDIAARLEHVGILAYVSSANSHLFGRIQTGALKVGLWIVLEHQYEDALAYLQNEKREITTALTAEEIEELKVRTQSASYDFFNRVLIYAAGFILVAAAALWYVVRNHV